MTAQQSHDTGMMPQNFHTLVNNNKHSRRNNEPNFHCCQLQTISQSKHYI